MNTAYAYDECFYSYMVCDAAVNVFIFYIT